MGQLPGGCCLALICVILMCNGHLMDDFNQPIYVLTNVKNVVNINKRLADFARMFDSVLRGARRRPLHWILLTKSSDVAVINLIVKRIIARKANVGVQVDYVDMDKLAVRFAAQVNLTRRFFSCLEPAEASPYYGELFHLYAVYHLAFPFERLIALDTDLYFQDGVDIADLDEHFGRMSPNHLIAMAPDLSPHYWYHFRQYRKHHPGSNVGKRLPGLQGFNGGLVLMNLGRMRQNLLYNSYFTDKDLEALVNKYEIDGCLAFQDFWTIMSMEHQQLFFSLDCTWNRQLDEMYGFVEHFGRIFEAFHQCDGDVKIYHANGGSLLPQNRFDSSDHNVNVLEK